MFDFSDSLNDFAPFSPMLLSVHEKINEKSKLLMDVFCVSSFFCLHNTDLAMQVLCLISMIHSMMLLLCLQYRSLLTSPNPFTWLRREFKHVIRLSHGRPSKLSSLKGTMFITSATRSIVHSPLIHTTEKKQQNMNPLFEFIEKAPSQTLQINVFFPFPIVDELQQNACFMVSFLCSL